MTESLPSQRPRQSPATGSLHAFLPKLPAISKERVTQWDTWCGDSLSYGHILRLCIAQFNLEIREHLLVELVERFFSLGWNHFGDD